MSVGKANAPRGLFVGQKQVGVTMPEKQQLAKEPESQAPKQGVQLLGFSSP